MQRKGLVHSGGISEDRNKNNNYKSVKPPPEVAYILLVIFY